MMNQFTATELLTSTLVRMERQEDAPRPSAMTAGGRPPPTFSLEAVSAAQRPSSAQASPPSLASAASASSPFLHSHRPGSRKTMVEELSSILNGGSKLRAGGSASGDGIPLSPLENMSMVSPPFTPTVSQINLVNAEHSDLSLRNESPRPDSDVADIALPRPSKTRTSHRASEVKNALSPELPIVTCESRARIPTTSGTEIFLHVYKNNQDNKEHLAIVFGHDIHSKSLFDVRPGETEQDRMTRGAYTGTLYPGRKHSMVEDEEERKRRLAIEAAEREHSSNGKSNGSSATDSTNAPVPAAGPAKKDVLCRIHSECYTGETAWSARCDCGEQLDEAARLMAKEGHGVIVYLRQEGRGIGLGEKLKAYNLQDLGADTVQANLMLRHPADGRSFSMATAILLDLGQDHIRLLTNNPDKIEAVEGKNGEIKVTSRVPMIPLSWQNRGGFSSKEVDKYLATKAERMGHLLDFDKSAS